MKNSHKLIFTTTLGLAALAIAIDHTRHRIPTPVSSSSESASNEVNSELEPNDDEGNVSPCSMGNPCSLNISPCALD